MRRDNVLYLSSFNDELKSQYTEIESIANQEDKHHNTDMDTPITRPEIDAKLATIEAKMDGKFDLLSQKLDNLTTSVGELKGDIISTKRSVWGAAIATVTIVLAVLAYGVSQYDSGRDTAQLVSETKQLLNQMKENQENNSSSQKPWEKYQQAK